jgi:hypothetical protein
MGFLPFIATKKAAIFVSGIAAGLALPLIIEARPLRKALAGGIALSMKLRDQAESALETLKEEAEDLYYEAKSRFEAEADDEVVEDEDLDDDELSEEGNVDFEQKIIFEDEEED